MTYREKFVNYYQSKFESKFPMHEKAAAVASSLYPFKGEATAPAIIIRSDLNGYSKCIDDNNLEPSDRPKCILDDFFSVVIGLMGQYGGVYYRDEGDCVVTIFSSYFHQHWNFQFVANFCGHIIKKKYGDFNLSAKCCLSRGEVVFYQKSHEKGADDWSIEGDPLIKAARIEEVVESKQRIYFDSSFDPDIYFLESPLSRGTNWGGTWLGPQLKEYQVINSSGSINKLQVSYLEFRKFPNKSEVLIDLMKSIKGD